VCHRYKGENDENTKIGQWGFFFFFQRSKFSNLKFEFQRLAFGGGTDLKLRMGDPGAIMSKMNFLGAQSKGADQGFLMQVSEIKNIGKQSRKLQ
jgi:hypothetical protein